jgi:alpha-beta hydrolase superfamily lysophospholipase
VGRVRVAFACLVTAVACVGAAAYARPAAATSGWQPVTIVASDSTQLACVYLIPSGTTPDGGWPGVILFHGFGESYADMEPIGDAVADFGIAVLACDARGTGASGGKFGLDGPTETQDARDIFNWFAGRSDVSDTQIGAMGLSLGGAAVWNAAVAGVPFKAIVPAITWTSLGAALNPNGVPKTGLVSILAQAVPLANWDPTLAQAEQDLLQGSVTPTVKSVETARSSRSQLHTLTVPTLLLQGRHDFLFDMDQATAAWKLLAGPKRLYLGDLGHPPAKNPPNEVPVYVGDAALWFDHYLNAAGGREFKEILLAHDPWDEKQTVYGKLPKTRTASVALPGSTRISGQHFAYRSARLTGGPHETFGDGSVSVHYSGAANWTHLVATVWIKGGHTKDGDTLVTEGAAPIKSSSGVVKIPLMNEADLLPRGKKLRVGIGATSWDDLYNLGISTYASLPPPGASITVGSAALKLSFLKHTVSK